MSARRIDRRRPRKKIYKHVDPSKVYQLLRKTHAWIMSKPDADQALRKEGSHEADSGH